MPKASEPAYCNTDTSDDEVEVTGDSVIDQWRTEMRIATLSERIRALLTERAFLVARVLDLESRCHELHAQIPSVSPSPPR